MLGIAWYAAHKPAEFVRRKSNKKKISTARGRRAWGRFDARLDVGACRRTTTVPSKRALSTIREPVGLPRPIVALPWRALPRSCNPTRRRRKPDTPSRQYNRIRKCPACPQIYPELSCEHKYLGSITTNQGAPRGAGYRS